MGRAKKAKKRRSGETVTSELPVQEEFGDEQLSWDRGKRSVRSALIPPSWVLFVVALSIVAIVAVRTTYVLGDYAKTNIATLIAAFLALMTPVIWFAVNVPLGIATRLAPLGVVLAAMGASAAILRIDRTDGYLVPTFRFRWAEKPDQMLPPAKAAVGPVDLQTTTPRDFPQFLGPQRNASLNKPVLAHSWVDPPPRLLWHQSIGAGWSSFAVVNDFAVTMEQRGEEELVTCYEMRTGKLRWVHAVKARYETVLGGVGPRATPTIDEGIVYALGATGILRAIDGATGSLVWQKDLPTEFGSSAAEDLKHICFGRSNSPLVVGELLVVPAGGVPGKSVSLVAYDKSTGKKVWEGGDQQISYSSPSLATLLGVTQIVIVNEATVTGHDIQTGAVLWSHSWPGHSNTDANVSQAVPVAVDRFLLTNGYGNGASLVRLARDEKGAWTTETVWQEKGLLRTKFSNVTTLDGYAYGLSDGIMECVQIDSGRRAWKKGRYANGQILRVADLILVQCESGEMALVEATADGHEELDRFEPLADMTWNNPTLCGPFLLVRNAQQAACYELPVLEAEK